MQKVDEVSRAAWEEARRAWPDFEVDCETFAAFLAPRMGDGPLNHADLYLVCACLAQNPKALRAFETQVLKKLTPTFRKIEDSSAFADELTQLTRTKLFMGDGKPKLLAYAGKGSLLGWTKAVGVRLALNLKKRGPKEELHRYESLPDVALSGEPTLDLFRKEHQAAFNAAFAQALETLDSQERTVLRMSVLDGLSVDKIGDVFGVHRSTAARWIERSKAKLLEKTRERLAQQMKVAPSELDSFMRALVSKIEVSLRRAL